MDQYHKSHAKKVSAGTGGMRRKFKDKKLAHYGGAFTSTKVATKDEVRTSTRGRGANRKNRLKKALYVNAVTDKGMKKAKILGVVESPNPEYVRQNVITKGAVLNTDIGKVKVTNRVGQDGVVNGVKV